MSAKGDENRSVRFTKRRIRDAFLSILKTKPYINVTVAEIVRSAGISRSTFYTHYKDVYDLIEKIEDDINRKIAGKLADIDSQKYIEGNHPVITQMFAIMEENAEVLLCLLGDNGDPHYRYKFQKIMSDHADELWKSHAGKPEAFPLVTAFMDNGIIGLFMESHRDGATPDVDQLGFIAGEFLAFTRTLVDYHD